MEEPVATYRLQLHAGFTFADAVKAVPYLAELGVSHLYLSPILQAGPGSMHGYDVVDAERVSTDLGGEEGFRALVAAARGAGLEILLDIVPNHMSIAGTDNRWWRDVLENGAASAVAHYFDVDWGAADDRILLPILGERYGRALTSGVLKLCRQDGLVMICAHDHRLPIAPRALGPIVRRAGERAGQAELCFVGDALAELPAPGDRERRERRHRDKAVLLARLRELTQDPILDRALESELAAINADPAALDTVLEAQNYRLAFWRVAAASQLSFRRFFDITTLVGMRAEEPDVVAASHRRIAQWLADGTLAGVRVDHVDGLRAPGAYLAWLRSHAPGAWIVVEKILATGERLPEAWACDGTTGYELIDWMTGLLADPAAVEPLTGAFEAYTGTVFDPSVTGRAARLEVMSDALHSELARVTELAMTACGTSAACRDFTRDEIRGALAEIFASYPTYRTYFGEGSDSEDHQRVALAVARAAEADPTLDPDLLAYLEAALSFELLHPDAQRFAQSVQQATGAILAKGDEDTTAYRAIRLLARCEVGSDVRVLATPPAVIHARLAKNPVRSLLASSTHDTKRSEDVRARILAISELPDDWATSTMRWRERAEGYWGGVEPDRTFEYAAWQTLVGAWPLPEERAQQWAEKATREARQRTSWRRPDEAYEAARRGWIAGVYADAELAADLAHFVSRVTPRGDRNSLAQLLVKLTAPGVPDIYQGTELRDDSLVDPDNRRPVDLAARARALREVSDAAAPPTDLDRAKLFVIRRVLGVRRRDPARFAGGYRALAATGAEADRLFAFARLVDDQPTAITVVPRLTSSPSAKLELPAGAWTNLLGGSTHRGTVLASALLAAFPVAFLVPARAG